VPIHHCLPLDGVRDPHHASAGCVAHVTPQRATGAHTRSIGRSSRKGPAMRLRPLPEPLSSPYAKE